MEKSKSSGIIKSASAILAVVIIVVVILLINQRRRIEEHHRAVLKETIEFNTAYDERLDSFVKYADVKFAEKSADIALRSLDYDRYEIEEYGAVHISMWDIDALDKNTYANFFGYPMIYADYRYKTPMELKEYLTTVLESQNIISHFYINIDPFILEQNYIEATHYDEEPVSFENYIHNEIFPIFDAYPEVSFEFFLPARPTSYWASLQNEEYTAIMDKWYVFLMYLHWCPNTAVRFLGDQEWLVSNDYNYESSERFTDEIMRQVYIYLYAYEQYEVNAPELKQKKNIIDRYIRKEKNGDYDVCDFSGKKIVFMGDSLFDYVKIDSVSIPGVVKRLTGAECYNVSLGGTLASAIDPYGFTRVANAVAMKGAIDLDSRSRKEALRFADDYKEGDSVIFVILYGLNDYTSDVPITPSDIVVKEPESEGDSVITYMDESTFVNSYEYGLESLRLAYPDAEIMAVLPYIPDGAEEGKKKTASGKTLNDYIKAIENICTRKGIPYYDMYHNGPINKSNRSEYLTDGTHTNEKGAFMLGECISKELSAVAAE